MIGDYPSVATLQYFRQTMVSAGRNYEHKYRIYGELGNDGIPALEAWILNPRSKTKSHSFLVLASLVCSFEYTNRADSTVGCAALN